jgi:hypothetical protein
MENTKLENIKLENTKLEIQNRIFYLSHYLI